MRFSTKGTFGDGKYSTYVGGELPGDPTGVSVVPRSGMVPTGSIIGRGGLSYMVGHNSLNVSWAAQS